MPPRVTVWLPPAVEIVKLFKVLAPISLPVLISAVPVYVTLVLSVKVIAEVTAPMLLTIEGLPVGAFIVIVLVLIVPKVKNNVFVIVMLPVTKPLVLFVSRLAKFPAPLIVGAAPP